MKIGVSITPWFSVSRPRRADVRPLWSVLSNLKSSMVVGLVGQVYLVSEQHGIAVAEEAVALRNRVRIRGADLVVAGEGRHQHQQRRFRQVEIGDQARDSLERIAGRDEQRGVGAAGLQRTGLRGRL